MALIENRSSESIDPIQQYSLLSMFHRTLKDAPIANDSDNLDSVHNFLKTMDLKNTDTIFGEAKEIVQGSSELLGSKLALNGASENNDEAVTKCNGNPRERRPALGRKRARFSMKPDISLPSASLEPSLDIDQLHDPEEFFAAYYKLEYAKEEIERQTGGNMTGKNDYNPSANQRHRRPSIFGKSVSYKHNYSSAILEDDDTVIDSQETSQQDNHSPSKFVSQEPSNPNVESEERELAESAFNPENTAGGLLDDLLSTDIENLNGDGALSLLQVRLQIKPVDLDKYRHDFSEVGNVDSMDFNEEVSVSRKALSDIQNVMNGLSEKNPGNYKQVEQNQNHSLTLSTPPKRPSATSSLLERGNVLSKPFHFSFSAADLDLSPAGSPVAEYSNRQSDNLCTRNEPSIPGKLKSQVEDEAKIPACDTLGSKQGIPGVNCLETSASFNTSRIDIDARPKESHDGLVNTNEGNHASVGDILHEALSSAHPDIGSDDLSRGCSDTVVLAHGLSESAKNVEDVQRGASSTQPDADTDDLTAENLKISQSQLGHQEPVVAEDHFTDGHTTNAETCLEQQNEEHPKIFLKDGKKAGRARGLRQRKELSRRQSLAAAGTCWKSGVRRSNRIKMRPLEYWKGERFLYGRVHESLTTVIGVKFISSPSPGGKEPRFRVTSYLSDEHKELVESAALH